MCTPSLDKRRQARQRGGKVEKRETSFSVARGESIFITVAREGGNSEEESSLRNAANEMKRRGSGAAADGSGGYGGGKGTSKGGEGIASAG